MCFIVDDAMQARLRSFVENGGTLVATYLTGIVDTSSNCHLGGWPGAGLRELFGVWAEEIDVLLRKTSSASLAQMVIRWAYQEPFGQKRYRDILHNESAYRHYCWAILRGFTCRYR